MIRGVADSNAALLLNYRFKGSEAKGLSLNAGINYSGKRAGDVPSAAFTSLGVVEQVSFYLKPQYVNTIGVTYRMNDKYTFRLKIDNIFDETDYFAVAGGRSWGTGLTTATGRNIRFSTTFTF